MRKNHLEKALAVETLRKNGYAETATSKGAEFSKNGVVYTLYQDPMSGSYQFATHDGKVLYPAHVLKRFAK